MPEPIEDRLLAELRQRRPARLLAAGAKAEALAARYRADCQDCTAAALPDDADLALAILDENAKRADALALVGLLKQKAPVVLVAATDGQPLDFNDFLAFGMQRLSEAGARRLYLFDLYTYKPAPDWLNAKYWAHPERWKP